ncbi:MAG: hypothetical protein JJLCMIEE_02406 [Acidimicrobiales bacterium]|nr:hypothetical protein [Acidimicrobiales bacterium]
MVPVTSSEQRGGPAQAVITPLADEKGYADELIRRLCDELPPRRTGTPAELRAQEFVAAEFDRIGLSTELEPFRFNDNLYAALALHFGVGVLASVVAGRRPVLGAGLHALVGGSYWLDSTRRAEILRRALPYRGSQNLVATIPAAGETRLRIVCLSHIDASYTGRMFEPRFKKRFYHKGESAPYTAKSLAIPTHAELVAAAVALTRAVLGKRSASAERLLRQIEYGLTVPSLLGLVLNGEIVLRDLTVPGASDNLTGVAACLLLANRLRAERHPDVEYVFVATGAEEAGTGGARRLVEAKREEWSPADTVVLAIDTLSGGEIFYGEEGEFGALVVPSLLEQAFTGAAASDPDFDGIRKYRVPVGGTDAQTFSYAGYEAGSIICVDLSEGSPRHYHHPSDTPDNVDLDTFALALDFAEAVIDRIVEARLGY